MPSFSFSTSAGADVYAPVASYVAPQLPVALQTTLNASTTVLQSQICNVAQTAAVAVALPLNQSPGMPIVVTNIAATNAVSVFPPWNPVTGAAAGGKIYGASASAPSANAAVSVAAFRTVTFWPHGNGIDYTAVWGAVA